MRYVTETSRDASVDHGARGGDTCEQIGGWVVCLKSLKLHGVVALAILLQMIKSSTKQAPSGRGPSVFFGELLATRLQRGCRCKGVE